MKDWTIYHNPRCSKSRQTLELLESKKISPVVVEYLKNPPSVEELKTLLKKLKMKAGEIVRTKEALFKELDLDLTNEMATLKALHKNPVLLERPIVVHKDKAVVGRPPENVLSLL